jgi:hypothetical protein
MQTEFKKFDFVYNKLIDSFGIVSETAFKQTLKIDVYKHNGIGPSFIRTEYWFKHNTVKCYGPDNLKNRLAIRIKHGQ